MSRRSNRRGAQAVEFALVLPLLLAIFGGIVDYGWYFSQNMAVISAARDGARAGSTTTATSGATACSRAEEAAFSSLQAAGFTTATRTMIVVDQSDSIDGTSGGDVMLRVVVAIPYGRLWLPAGWVPADLRGRIVSRAEDQDLGNCSI